MAGYFGRLLDVVDLFELTSFGENYMRFSSALIILSFIPLLPAKIPKTGSSLHECFADFILGFTIRGGITMTLFLFCYDY